MKTPREILLARHKAVERKLDDVRKSVVRKLNNEVTKTQSIPDGIFSSLLRLPTAIWRELIWPARRIWTGLVAVWILILAANFSMRDRSELKMASSPTSQEIIVAFRQEQRLMNELIGPNDPQTAEAPTPRPPRPASERHKELVMT